MRTILCAVSSLALIACGAPVESHDAGCDTTAQTGSGGGAGQTCSNPTGRTCDSAFGLYHLRLVPPAGCTLNNTQGNTLQVMGFDAGAGNVLNHARSMPDPATRMGCDYVFYESEVSQVIDFTYDPACDTLRGRIPCSPCTVDGGAPAVCEVRLEKL
jgi:hypothetical protein